MEKTANRIRKEIVRRNAPHKLFIWDKPWDYDNF